MLTIIAALAENRAIGYRNELVYHISADLKRFKALTTGHTLVMGRRTFESLPKGALPHRRNIVLTRHADARFDGAETFPTLEEALRACEGEEVFVIGGASVYAEALPKADCLELTHVAATPAEADVFFPEINESEWTLTAREDFPADEAKGQPPYAFCTYRRKEK